MPLIKAPMVEARQLAAVLNPADAAARPAGRIETSEFTIVRNHNRAIKGFSIIQSVFAIAAFDLSD
jgi:hypothetical protein